jgi:hypothetical protein
LKVRLDGPFGIMPVWVVRICRPEFWLDGSIEVRPRGSSWLPVQNPDQLKDLLTAPRYSTSNRTVDNL